MRSAIGVRFRRLNEPASLPTGVKNMRSWSLLILIENESLGSLYRFEMDAVP
jgi:hypothetical protein